MTLDDFNGEKMLGPFLEGLYQMRYKKYKSVGYGQPQKEQRLTLSNQKKISIGCFDKKNSQQNLMRVLFVCGAMFGFRRSEEHTYP